MTKCNIVVEHKKNTVSALKSLLLIRCGVYVALCSFCGVSDVLTMTQIINKIAEISFCVTANTDFSYVSKTKC